MKELEKLIMAAVSQLHASTVLTPGERAPGTHWIGGWVGPGTGLDVVEKRNILPLPRIQPRPSSPSRRHGHRSDKNGVYSTSHLFFT
jgi:hypothetical protein